MLTCFLPAAGGVVLLCVALVAVLILAGRLNWNFTPATASQPAQTVSETPPVIVQSETPQATYPTATNIPAMQEVIEGLGVVDATLTQDRWGGLKIIGLLRNKNPFAVRDISLQASLLDGSGALLSEQWAYISSLGPGSEFLFIVYTDTNFQAVRSYEIVISQGVYDDTYTGDQVKLGLQKKRITNWKDHGIVICGELINQGNHDIYIIEATAAVFNQSGQILGAVEPYVPYQYLNPQETIPICFELSDLPDSIIQEISDYQLFIASSLEDAPADLPIVTSVDNFYIDRYGIVHLVGLITNNGDTPAYPFLVAGLYDKDGNVISATNFYPSPNIIFPNMSIPYDIHNWGPVNDDPGLSQEIVSYQVIVGIEEFTDKPATPIAITQGDPKWGYENGWVNFTGQVINPASGPLDIYIVAAVVDKTSNKLIATDVRILSAAAPGSHTYEIYVSMPEGFDPQTAIFGVDVIGKQP
ncbi:MAG: FxLYD domain-containing protein [Chloroflexota bacterium]